MSGAKTTSGLREESEVMKGEYPRYIDIAFRLCPPTEGAVEMPFSSIKTTELDVPVAPTPAVHSRKE